MNEWIVLVATRVPGVLIGVGVCLSGLREPEARIRAEDRNAVNTDPNVYYWPAARMAGRSFDSEPARRAFEARDHNAAELARVGVEVPRG